MEIINLLNVFFSQYTDTIMETVVKDTSMNIEYEYRGEAI
jgi:hypothetical protein